MLSEDISDDQLQKILLEIEDYQISHGSLLKIPRGTADVESPVAIARPIGVSIVPTIFPHSLFKDALDIQSPFNELYMKVAEDDAWIEKVTRELRKADEFAAKLWNIWERVRDEGEVQPLRCGVFRSDYMLHREQGEEAVKDWQLKQVEFNTYSCAGGSHANIVANMHRYLGGKGAYGLSQMRPSRLPLNNSVKAIVASLETAHRAYGPPVSMSRQTVILMTVQPYNVNICDERPIEYAMSECETPVVLYRVEFSGEVTDKCSIGPNRELLFRPSPGSDAVEVSVVYQRAGYDAREYNLQGIEARYLLERSRAIKCPSILSHISGFKKIQQELTRPGTMERWLSPERADRLRNTFMPLYPFGNSAEGLHAQQLALDKKTAGGYILKPSLDGGGHNIHGAEIPAFLRTVPREQWSKYVLMEKINAPRVHGLLVSPTTEHRGLVISELGILGTCLWKRTEGETKADVIGNAGSGWTFKSKPSDVGEISVVMGYGCFDCPYLFDDTQEVTG